MKKIDIHVHTAKYCYDNAVPVKYGADRPFANPKELIEMYRPIEVVKAVILPIVSPECSFQVSNEGAYAAFKAHPDTFEWFCCLDPRNGANSEKTDFSGLLEHYKTLGAKGVGELTSNMRFDGSLTRNLFFHCQNAGLPVLFHISPKEGANYGLIDELGLPGLEAALKEFPRLNFIGHSQPFWAEMSADLTEEKRNTYPSGKVTGGRIAELLSRYPNLYCDMSAGSGANAFMRDPEYAYRFIERFADRLLYGTDICDTGNTHQNIFNVWLEKSHNEKCISRTNYEKICYKNASKLLSVKV